MKKTDLKITACALAAALVISAGMPADASDAGTIGDISCGEDSGDSFIGNVEYLAESSADEHGFYSRALYGTPDAADEEFFRLCAGSRHGYEDMLLRSSPDMRRDLYDELDSRCRALWSSSGELSLLTTSTGKSVLFRIDNSGRGLSKNEIIESYYTYLYDNPEFYFITSSIGIYPDGDLAVYTDPSYLGAAQRAEYQRMIKDYCADSAALVSREKTAYTNALVLHDKVCGDMDYRYMDDGRTPSDAFAAHNVLGGIAEGSGVCESYSKIYSMILNYCGIDCIFVAGNGYGSGHAWNMLLLDDGQYYFADLTWDDLRGNRRYFAGGSDLFGAEHIADSPSGSGLAFLYELPDAPSGNFSLAGYFAALSAQMDINSDGVFNNRDLKALQNRLTDSVTFGEPSDINLDGRHNNRDLKALQMYLIRYMNGE